MRVLANGSTETTLWRMREMVNDYWKDTVEIEGNGE